MLAEFICALLLHLIVSRKLVCYITVTCTIFPYRIATVLGYKFLDWPLPCEMFSVLTDLRFNAENIRKCKEPVDEIDEDGYSLHCDACLIV
jgi:hypothetical protein